jgi:hypothetical protein
VNYQCEDVWQLPITRIALPSTTNNSCFARAALQCLTWCKAGDLWERRRPCGRERICDSLSPAAEEVARAHLREALRQFSNTGNEVALAAVKHLVGSVLRVEAHRTVNLDDGRQHDTCEFLLRLLSVLGVEARHLACEGSLRWEVERPHLRFEEREDGLLAGAMAAVAHTGSGQCGHYTAYGRAGQSWAELRGGGGLAGGRLAGAPLGRVKLVFLEQ